MMFPKIDSILKHSGMMFSATVISSFVLYFFHLYMGRELGPAGYGVLSSVISLLYITSVPLGTIQMVIAKLVSEYNARLEGGKIHFLLIKAIKKALFFGIMGVIVVTVLSPVISGFLNIPSNIPIIIFGVIVLFSVLSPITSGALQGVQDFRNLSAVVVIGSVGRLVSGVVLVTVGLGVNGAILAYGIASLLMFLLAWIPIRYLFKEKKDSTIDRRSIYKYSIPVVIVFFCLMVMTNADILVVKHYFSEEEAGFYAAASLIAKVIFFATTSIAVVMFPKVTELNVASKDECIGLFRKGLRYTAVIAVLGVGTYFIIPEFIVSLLFGSSYTQTAGLIGWFGLMIALFSFVNLFFYYVLAIDEKKYVKVLVAITVAEVALLFVFHSTLIQILQVLSALLFISIIILYVPLIFELKKNESNDKLPPSA